MTLVTQNSNFLWRLLGDTNRRYLSWLLFRPCLNVPDFAFLGHQSSVLIVQAQALLP